MLGNRRIHARRSREVKEEIPAGVPFAADLLKFCFEADEFLRAGRICGDIKQTASKCVPQDFFRILQASEFLHCTKQVLAKGIMRHDCASDADNGESGGKQALSYEIKNRGNKLTLCQISRRTEDYHRASTREFLDAR
jgi:hypothetical protein